MAKEVAWQTLDEIQNKHLASIR